MTDFDLAVKFGKMLERCKLGGAELSLSDDEVTLHLEIGGRVSHLDFNAHDELIDIRED